MQNKSDSSNWHLGQKFVEPPVFDIAISYEAREPDCKKNDENNTQNHPHILVLIVLNMCKQVTSETTCSEKYMCLESGNQPLKLFWHA